MTNQLSPVFGLKSIRFFSFTEDGERKEKKKREVALARLTTTMAVIYGFEYVSEVLIVQLTLLEGCHLVAGKPEDEHTVQIKYEVCNGGPSCIIQF